MKILQINKLYYPIIGGIETVVKEVAEDLNEKDNFEVEVLACQKKGSRSEEVINGIKVYKAASYGKKLGMPLSLDFFNLLFSLEKKYDVLLFHFPFPLAALAIPFLKNKNIIILYHSDIVRQKFSRLLFLPFIKTSLRLSKKIITSSNNLAKNSPILKRFSSKTEIIPFGINIDDFFLTEKIKDTSEKIRSSYQSPILLSVGRLVYYKGYEYLIEAMEKINASLLIIGSGPLQKNIQQMITSKGLSEKIHIINHVDDLRPYYLACDIFIFPSIANSEAFGLVQLEAMAFGKPVINTNLPTGVPEVSLNGVSGLTVEPKNSNELSRAINELINNQDLKSRLGQAARNRVETIFNKNIFNKKLVDILRKNFFSSQNNNGKGGIGN